MCYCISQLETHLWLVILPLNSIVCVHPCRSYRGEPVAPGAKQTLHAVSSFNVLRVPAGEQPGGGDTSHSADGGGEGGTKLRARYHKRVRTLQV